MNLELLKNKKSKVVSAAALLPFTFFLTSCGLGANKASTQKEAAPKEETKKEAPQTVVVQQQEVAQTATPPASANTAEEYAQLLYKKEKLAAWLQKFETTTAKEKKNYFEELERLVEQVQELKKAFEKHEAMRGELTKLKRVMENAQQEVNIAGAYNYTLGKEVVLYLFTLKPIWGLFTGYAPTTSTFDQEEALKALKETTGKELEAKRTELKAHETTLKNLLDGVESRYKTALQRTESPVERADLLSSKAALSTVFNQLLAASNLLEANEENYRQHLRALHPTLPYALAKNAPAPEKDFVGDFLQDELTKAQDNRKTLHLKFKNLFMLEAGEGLSTLSPYVLLARAAEALRATEAETTNAKEELKALEKALEEAKTANPEFEQTLKAETFDSMGPMESPDSNENSANVSLMNAVEALREQVTTVNKNLQKLAEFEAQARVLADKLVLAQEALKEAKRQGFSLFKELGLYLFGFKFIWGATNGYAPTVSVDDEERLLQAAEEELKQFQNLNEEAMKNAEGELRISVNTFGDKYRTAKNRAKTAFQKAVLAKYYGQFVSLLTQYQGVLEKQKANRELFVDEIKAGTLYKGGKSTFISFLEYFAPALNPSEKTKTYGVKFKDFLPAKMVSETLQAESQKSSSPTKAAKEPENFGGVPKMFENFVTTTGAELLADLTRELEEQVQAYQTAKMADETHKSTKAKLNSGLQATAVVETKKQ